MYSPVLEGDVELLPNGVARCRGGCVISSSRLHFNEVPFVCAFSFDICALESKSTPEVQFGINHNGLAKLDFNYFALLASIRADSLRPHIPSDGLGVPIRLLVDKTNVRLYVNEVLCPMKYDLDSNSMSFYLKVQADEAIIFTPFCQEEVPQAFFPYLAPRLWSQLPWRVTIRDFTVRGTHDSIRNVFAEDELLPLPGLHGLKYFEVEMRSFATESMRFEATLYVGLVEQPRTSTEVPPGMASRSIGISTEDHTVSVDGTSEWSFPQELTSGCILGLGVQETGSILITLNGKRLNTNLLSTPNFKRFIPAVATEGCASECLINLGQRPFAFPDARPPNGWCYYTRLAPDQCLFRKGSPNGYHLLHFFPFGSPGHRTADSHVVARELRENERYELTALKTGGDDLFGIGLSDCDFAMGNMVGWDQRTLGIHSDDGMLFRENGGGSRQVIDSGNLKDGETIGLLYDRHVVKAYRNGRVSDVVDDWLMKPYPTFSITGSFIVIANFGEMPFVSDGGSDDPKGVTLYNGRQVTVTNERSEEVGLCIGDRVEARDLSFRGTYVGEFNGYFLFMVKGLDTVIPFEETDPLLVRRMIRVVARPKQAPITQFGLTSNAVVLYTNKSAKNEYGSLCATPYGISMMIGRNNDSYVMRPIVDLVNNAPLFTIPISCQLCRLFEPGQMSRFRSSDILPLDVVESSDPGTRLVLLLGNGLGWNGSKLAPFKGKHRVYFRFFGLGFRRIQVHPTYIVNHGTRAGGQGYLPYYRGTEGTAFFQSSVTQRSYGSKGLTPVPGVALYLLRTLNEHLLKTASVTPPPSDPPSDMSEWCYDPELDQQSRHIDVPLVTESHYP